MKTIGLLPEHLLSWTEVNALDSSRIELVVSLVVDEGATAEEVELGDGLWCACPGVETLFGVGWGEWCCWKSFEDAESEVEGFSPVSLRES